MQWLIPRTEYISAPLHLALETLEQLLPNTKIYSISHFDVLW